MLQSQGKETFHLLKGHQDMLGSFDKDGYLYCFTSIFKAQNILHANTAERLQKWKFCLSTKLHGDHIPEDHNLGALCFNTKAEKIAITAEN